MRRHPLARLFAPNTGSHTRPRSYGRGAAAEFDYRSAHSIHLDEHADDAGQLAGVVAGELHRLDYIRPTPRAIAAAHAWLTTFPWEPGQREPERRLRAAELRQLVVEAWDHVAALDAALRAWAYAVADDTDYLPALGGRL